MTICSIFGDEEFENIREIRKRLSKRVKEMVDFGVEKFLIGQINTFDIMSLSVCAEQCNNDNFDVNCVCSTEDRFGKTKVFIDVFFGVKTCLYKNNTQQDPIFYMIKNMIDDSEIIIIYFSKQESSEEIKFAYDYAQKLDKNILIL